MMGMTGTRSRVLFFTLLHHHPCTRYGFLAQINFIANTTLTSLYGHDWVEKSALVLWKCHAMPPSSGSYQWQANRRNRQDHHPNVITIIIAILLSRNYYFARL